MSSEQDQLNLECDDRMHPGDYKMLPMAICCCCYLCWSCLVPKVRGVPVEATLMPKAEQLQLLAAMKGEWKLLPTEGILYEKATFDDGRLTFSGGSFLGRHGRPIPNPPLVQYCTAHSASTSPFQQIYLNIPRFFVRFVLTFAPGPNPQVLANAERSNLHRSQRIDSC
jgi:hypothetical protein